MKKDAEAGGLRTVERKRAVCGMAIGMTRGWAVAALLLLLTLAAGAQTAPVLHHRSDGGESQGEAEPVTHGRTTLPQDASGDYAMNAPGESVEIELSADKLDGYITKMGDRDSDRGAPLTYFFATGTLDGQRLGFTTREVHGVWFSFTGTIVRGKAATMAEDGYYMLEGSLTRHDAAARTSQERHVSFPMTRQYADSQ